MIEVFEILQKDEKPSEGFAVGRVMPDGVQIAKANLKLHPKSKGLTNEDVQKYIRENYPELFEIDDI
jgi:hypothetical protein